jgi:hypothetical protein
MSENTRIWVEIIFNLAYLMVVWGLVIAMLRRRTYIPVSERRLTRLFIWAFTLLALGDTGHVGFRVLAYALGGLETTLNIAGVEIGLVGLGALSTGITVTLFYILMLMIWHERFRTPYGWFGYLLFIVSSIRLFLMIFPQNQWNSIEPPMPWGIYRNVPLIILGIGVAYLMIRDSIAIKDRTFTWIGGLILISYAMYIPVILFVGGVPVIGMLMIPKTLAYVMIGIIAYKDLFREPYSRLAVDTTPVQ